MFYIGCHLSPSAGLRSMGETALSIGATTLQFFTRNPRGGTAKPLDLSDVAAYLDFASAHGIGQIVAHAPFSRSIIGWQSAPNHTGMPCS